MNERTTQHASFVVERTYDASPARTFAAWADPTAKRQWFGGPDDSAPATYELDFRIGGQERYTGGGTDYAYEARYCEIVPDQRIVFTYTMDLRETRISVSLATIEFAPAEGGTRLVFTEQGAFLDGGDSPEDREHGTKALLDSLDVALRATASGVR